jgi:hypothetical protein
MSVAPRSDLPAVVDLTLRDTLRASLSVELRNYVNEQHYAAALGALVDIACYYVALQWEREHPTGRYMADLAKDLGFDPQSNVRLRKRGRPSQIATRVLLRDCALFLSEYSNKPPRSWQNPANQTEAASVSLARVVAHSVSRPLPEVVRGHSEKVRNGFFPIFSG